MQEFIEQEKARIQGMLRLFNERGSRMEFFGEDEATARAKTPEQVVNTFGL